MVHADRMPYMGTYAGDRPVWLCGTEHKAGFVPRSPLHGQNRRLVTDCFEEMMHGVTDTIDAIGGSIARPPLGQTGRRSLDSVVPRAKEMVPPCTFLIWNFRVRL